jgi:hypothetical protein
MNLDRLQRTLIAAARQAPPSDRVPYAFEQRVLARIRATKADPFAVWNAWLWRGAWSACVLACVTGAISFAQADLPLDESEPTLELASTHLESALFAPVSTAPENW